KISTLPSGLPPVRSQLDAKAMLPLVELIAGNPLLHRPLEWVIWVMVFVAASNRKTSKLPLYVAENAMLPLALLDKKKPQAVAQSPLVIWVMVFLAALKRKISGL